MAASILSYGLGYEAVFIMCSMASLTGLAIYVFTYMKLRPTNPRSPMHPEIIPEHKHKTNVQPAFSPNHNRHLIPLPPKFPAR